MKTSYKIRNYIDFLWAMTEKEMKARYKHTFLGFLWIVVNPLLQTLVIGFVFNIFIKEPIPNYYLYLLVGLLVWNFFNITVNKTTSAFVNERSLIKKSNFPREIILLSIVLSNFINTSIAFLFILVPSFYLGLLSIGNLPKLLFGIVLLLIFVVGFSLLASSLNVRFRDVNFFVQAGLILWFYATPIVYSVTFIPYELIWIWRLNPLTVVIQLFQNAFLSAPAPGIGMTISNTLIILIVFALGVYFFKKESKNFNDWI